MTVTTEQTAAPAGAGMAEFTPRAVIVGMLLGVLIMSENVYLGLKTGITEAGSILSAILAFAVFRSFRSNLTILENNTAQTLSSAAGSIGIIVSVIPALQLVGFTVSAPQMLICVLLIGFLGLFFAIPLRQPLIVAEQLTFPTGTACATTITAMHAKGEDASKKARALGITGLAAGAVTWFRDAVPIFIPTTNTLPLAIRGFSLEELSLGVYWSPLVIGVGLMIGLRIGLSLLLGAIASWGILGPALVSGGVIEKMGHTSVTHWTMWPAIALMVASGFTSLFLKSGMIVRSFKSMTAASYNRADQSEFPFRLWLWGLIIVAILVIVSLHLILETPLWLGLIAVVFAFLLATVAVRGYGETDISPVGTMGHANQIAAGILVPGRTVPNLAAGAVAAGCSDVASDLLQVLKTGHILGASPRRQITAQFIGVTLGSVIAVLAYLAVTSAHGVGTENVPAPGALPWSGMATLLSNGAAALPPYSMTAVIIGALLGVALTLLEKFKLGKYLPSPFGMGIGLVVPGFISVSIFLGSLVALVLEKKAPKWCESYLIPVASGGIAGEAIIGVIISILTVFGILAG